MRSLKVVTVLFLMVAASLAAAQTTVTVRLVDAVSGEPVTGAHISSDRRVTFTTSNNLGVFRIPDVSRPVSILVSHVGYHDTAFSVTTGLEPRTILLRPKLNQLAPFRVAGAPVDLIPDKPWFVTSYVHHDSGLVLLACPKKMFAKQSLYLLNGAQEVAASVPWQQAGTLFRDAAGDIWFRGNEWTTLLTITGHSIAAGRQVMSTTAFDEGIARIDLVAGDRYYFRHFRYDNQVADYYCFDLGEAKTEHFSSVSDPLGLKLRETRDIFETNEFERRFGEMCFFSPVFAPVVKRGSEVMIFNFTAGEIWHFDTLNRQTSRIPLSLQNTRGFKEALLNDHVAGRFYAVFESGGIFSIAEIDPDHGTKGPEVTIPAFPYIEQITVCNGKLYFLYKEDSGYQFKKIFMMPVAYSGGAVSEK